MSLYEWSVGTKVEIGYASALLALVIIDLTSYLRVTHFFGTARWVDHAYQVIDQIGDLPTDLVNIETAQRGYLITHDCR